MENIIFKRRSTRKFNSVNISDDEIKKILSAAMVAPTAVNQREWEFIVVKDKEKLEKLSRSTIYTLPAKEANVVIVLLANSKKFVKGEYWEQDLGAASQNILLEAVDLGLGGLWMGIAPHEDAMQYVRDVLDIPDYCLPYSLLAIGHHDYAVSERDNYDESLVHYDIY